MLENKKREFRRHVVVPTGTSVTGRAFVAHFEEWASELVGGLVNSKADRLDRASIERQRQRLTKRRDELADATQGEEAEEKEVNSQSSGRAEEYEDDAQRLTTLELGSNLVARNGSTAAAWQGAMISSREPQTEEFRSTRAPA